MSAPPVAARATADHITEEHRRAQRQRCLVAVEVPKLGLAELEPAPPRCALPLLIATVLSEWMKVYNI